MLAFAALTDQQQQAGFGQCLDCLPVSVMLPAGDYVSASHATPVAGPNMWGNDRWSNANCSAGSL